MTTNAVNAINSETGDENFIVIHRLSYTTKKFDLIEQDRLKAMLANLSLQHLHLHQMTVTPTPDESLDSSTFDSCEDLLMLTMEKFFIEPYTLESILIQCKSLEVFRFNLGTYPVMVLAIALTQCEKLKEIGIFGEKKFEQISPMPATVYHSNLETLSIRHIKFGDTGAKWLGVTLSQCSKVQHLDLRQNKITSNEAEILFTPVHSLGSSWSYLSTLDLGANSIGRDGACAISMCLQYWPNLKELDLSGCAESPNIGSDGTLTLADNLHLCSQLTKLKLKYNDISLDIAQRVIEALKTSIHLSELDLSHNSIQEVDKVTLQEHSAEAWKEFYTTVTLTLTIDNDCITNSHSYTFLSL